MVEREAPAERILKLAAYARDRKQPITLDDIVRDVPGCANSSIGWRRLGKRGRD